MPINDEIITNNLSVNTKNSAATILYSHAQTLKIVDFFEKCYLDNNSLIIFSYSCIFARDISYEFRKRYALEPLLNAIVHGNKDLAKKIVTSYPEIMFDSTGTVKDFLNKLFKGLSPIQLAMCVGDEDMLSMMLEILEQKKDKIANLNLNPIVSLHQQFNAIYPNGINALEREQLSKAQEFKEHMLKNIFDAINNANIAFVELQLNSPKELINTPLSVAINSFRSNFSLLLAEQNIFNPFYLQIAIKFYGTKIDSFNGHSSAEKRKRRNLFLKQVIGYIQRNLSACYLQAYAQGIYFIVEAGEKPNRSFELRGQKELFILPTNSGPQLGFDYVITPHGQQFALALDPDVCHNYLNLLNFITEKNIKLKQISNKIELDYLYYIMRNSLNIIKNGCQIS